MILDLAIGGEQAVEANETGIDTAALPATMEIEYVRVYECRSALNMSHCETPVIPEEQISQLASVRNNR